MTHTRITALLTAALLLLTACAGGANTSTTAPFIPPAADGKVYAASYASLPEGYTDAGGNGRLFHDDRLWLTLWEDAGDGLQQVIASVRPDGSDFRVEPFDIPDEGQVQGIAVSPEGDFWVQQSVWRYDQETMEATSEHWLRRYGPDGAEKQAIDLATVIEAQDFYASGMACDADGALLFIVNDAGYVLSPEGTLLFVLDGGSTRLSEVSLDAEGRFLARTMGQGSWEIRPVDMDACGYGKALFSSDSIDFDRVVPGRGDYRVYTSGDLLYGWNEAAGELTPILDWLALDANSEQFEAIWPVGEEDFFVLSMDDNWEPELIYVTRVEASAAQRTTLTLATANGISQALKAAVISFNKASDTYRVEVTDYFTLSGDLETAQDHLNNAIISGDAPDIIAANYSSDIAPYVAKAALLDLSAFLDGDTGLSRSDLVPCVLTACTYADGGIYELPTNFDLFTLMGRKSVLGDRTGWTVDEMVSFFEANPGAQGFADMDRETALMYFTILTQDQFIDQATGACSYDSPAFVQLLEFIRTIPEEIDYDPSPLRKLMEDKALTSTEYFSDIDTFQFYYEALSGDITFPGFPGEAGQQGALMMTDGVLSVSAKTAHPEGAWAFLCHVIEAAAERGNHYIHGIPVLQKGLDAMIADAQTVHYAVDENGVEYEAVRHSIGINDVSLELYAITDEELEAFLALLESTKRAARQDRKLYAIIAEDAAAFFAGAKSAEETAAVIQSRVGVYLSEMR